jgi:hypothetical protein
VQRNGHSLTLLAIPKDGIYERGVSNVRTVLQGLKRVDPGVKVTPSSSVPFPSQRDVQDVWRLRWHDAAWHLTSITSR